MFWEKGLQILGFPCNQFGLQENSANEEIPNMLKYVRPGNDFVPMFPLSKKILVNGEQAHPLYQWLKEQVPCEPDLHDTWVIEQKPSALRVTQCKPGDVRWNFEMFLVDRDGKRMKRYHPKLGRHPHEIIDDIVTFLGVEFPK